MKSDLGRRRFLVTAGVVATGCSGASSQAGPAPPPPCASTGSGTGLGYCLVEKLQIRIVGAAKLAVGQVVLVGVDDNSGVLLARDAKGFYALSATCSHACCTVALCGDAACSAPQLAPPGCAPTPATSLVAAGGIAFICPCHGSAYGADGSVLSGPSTTPLPAVAVRLDGSDAIVDLSRKAGVSDRTNA